MYPGCAFNFDKEELMSYPMSSIESRVDLGLETLSYDSLSHEASIRGNPLLFNKDYLLLGESHYVGAK